jgi:hypothetical protein
MGTITALMAGEKVSAGEVLAEALGAADDVKAAIVLLLDKDDIPDILCSAANVKEIAYLERVFADFVGEVVRGSYSLED